MYEFAHNFLYDQATFVLTLIGSVVGFFLLAMGLALATIPSPYAMEVAAQRKRVEADANLKELTK